ncbi:MAG: hypothetical protein MJ149_00995, partial [Clostridia bacterium]|nr:hypothetical protein [Clostridia bacterium]
MKKKIFGFLSLLVLAIGSLMFSMPLNSNYAYAADDEVVESHYLRDAETQQIESTDLVVAKTVGYGSYIIGTKNVKLTTTPEPAFHLVGWYVGELGSGEFYDEDSADGKYLVDLENLEFTIINAEESLKINPVCEYIEFVADFSAFEPVVPEGELPEMRTYHLNEQFNQTFNIKNNIDITHVYLNEAEGFARITKDAFGRATAVTISYIVTEDVVMTLNYTQLYQATIKPFVKNPGDSDYALATGEESSLLLGTIQATNVFGKLNESTYLVKNSADNSNFTFKIVAVNISKNIDSRMYNYYNVSQNTPTEQGFEMIDHDFDVTVCYDSVPYTIDFTFALYENGYASIFGGGYNVETTISSQRGITHTINKTDVSNNYGYAFYGFAVLTEQEIRDGFVRERNTSIQIAIDKDKPSNQHVYMLFTKVAYTLQLTNYNTIDLVYRSNTTYPLNQATLSFDRLNESYSQTIEGGALKASGTTEFDKYKVTVTDENLKITPITNLGFSITKYKFIVNGVESEAFDLVDGVLTLDLTPEFVQNYVYNDVLSIAFVEDYEYYTVNYYTVSTLDSMSGYVFMASLSATSTDAGAIITEQTEAGLYRTVTISHLKRYSEVTLKSTGEIQTGSVHYNFVKFVTEDGTTTYYPEDAKLSQADVSLMIEGDRSINVVYCVPSVHFSIKTVKTEICDLAACSQDPINKLYLTQGDEEEERLTPEVGQTLSWVIDLSDGRSNVITVYFDTNNVIKFGYSFDSFSLRQSGESAEISGETQEQDGVYSFRFAINTAESESGLGYNLSINFVVTDFVVDLNKTNSSTGETTVERYTINTEQPAITFEMEEGFYVNYVAFGSDEKIEYASLEQSNEYTGNVFSCNLTEFLEELTAYGNTITMHVTLKLHTYT